MRSLFRPSVCDARVGELSVSRGIFAESLHHRIGLVTGPVVKRNSEKIFGCCVNNWYDGVCTARRVCIARTMPWQDVCLSVCLSVCPSVGHTPVSCVNGYTYPESFLLSGSPTILVFPHQTGLQYSDGDPFNGGVECKGV